MLNKVKKYIEKQGLLGDGIYIVALSGGADSVCLFRVMKTLGYQIEAVHCNFRLRGDESNRDEAFCERLCKVHGVPFHRIHFDTKEYAVLHHVSIEMAARELRYSYFERLRVAIGAEAVVVAHHGDDNIETLLLNLVRGTGIHGLEGMKPRNGNIIRPLLCVSKDEILSYLSEIHQDYITDSSNLVDDVQRNKVRLNIIPLLKEVNPAAMENIRQTMQNLNETAKVYDASIAKSMTVCLKDNAISLNLLRQQSSPESVLYEILKTFSVPSKIVRDVYANLDAPVGKYWQWGEWTLAKDRDSLLIDKTPERIQEMMIPEEGVYCFNGDSEKLSLSVVTKSSGFLVSRDPHFVTLDADKVTFPLIIRQVRVGDTFHPFGMKGKKLVSDFLTDKKLSYFEKKRQLVLTDAQGTIIWLIGRRVAHEVSVSPNTINVLNVRYSTKTELL